MHRTLLLFAVGFALVGCGQSTPTTPAEPAAKPGPEVMLPSPVAQHEMDPAKHVVPQKQAAGQLGGKPFVPDRVTLEGKALTFRQGTDFFADLQIKIFFADYKPSQAVKITILPATKWHEATVPSLHISQRRGEELPKTEFTGDGYALTLELAPRKDGKIAGSIYLSLPDADKSFLAGTFSATYDRELDDRPEADDRPYIAGRITHSGKPKQSLTFRYAALPAAGGEPISDGIGSQLKDDGGLFSARSTNFAPRVASLRPGKMGEEYDCARLPPGKYFLIARLDDGPAGWKLVDVGPETTLDAPLAIPSAASGQLEVTIAAKVGGQVQAIPAGLKLDDPTGTFTTSISGALNAYANVVDGKATLKNLAPGTYEVSLRTGARVYRGEATVVSDQTAKVELK